MRLQVRDGVEPGPLWRAAVIRGVQALGLADVDVLATHDFDAAVRELIGSTTYSADRGTGTVAAKTLQTPSGPVIVVNCDALTEDNLPLVERTLAHEAGHALIDARGEIVAGRSYLSTSEWFWHLICVGGFSLHEVRCELSVRAVGYPPSGSATSDHIVEVAHATAIDLLQALQDPASLDPEVLMEKVIQQLDRLSKVLAYAATEQIASGREFNVAGEGSEAFDLWQEFIEPTWERRLQLYRSVPAANSALLLKEWDRLLVESADIEGGLLRCLGFEFRDGVDGNWGFYRTVSDERLREWIERAKSQARRYASQPSD